jgi:hypothetical protein
MRALILGLASALALAGTAVADSSHFVSTSGGHQVQRPVGPRGATARCKDGTWSFSKHHQGTCAHHGGVAEWL